MLVGLGLSGMKKSKIKRILVAGMQSEEYAVSIYVDAHMLSYCGGKWEFIKTDKGFSLYPLIPHLTFKDIIFWENVVGVNNWLYTWSDSFGEVLREIFIKVTKKEK